MYLKRKSTKRQIEPLPRLHSRLSCVVWRTIEGLNIPAPVAIVAIAAVIGALVIVCWFMGVTG